MFQALFPDIKPKQLDRSEGHPGSSIPLVLRIPTLTVLLDMGSRVAFKILPKSTPIGHGGTCPGLRRLRQEDGKFKGHITKQHA